MLDYGRAMYWQYLPDGLTKALLDEGGERASYAYDANGNRISATEATGLVSAGQAPLAIDLGYDSLDQLAKTRTPKPSSSNYLATYLSYDLHCNTAVLEENREESSGGSQVVAGRVFAYTYDTGDRPTGQIDDYATSGSSGDDEQLVYGYNARSELTSQKLQKGGSGAWVDELSFARTYFENGKLKTLVNKDAAGAMVEQHTLSYIQGGTYLNGNRVSDVFQLKGPDASAACYAATCTASWSYDARERLVREVSGTGTTTSFTVDVIGNVISESSSGGSAVTRTYNGQQLATQTAGGVTTRFVYDSLGNQDCAVKSSYGGTVCPGSGAELLEDWVYDYKSRLAGYRSFDGNGGLVNTVSYTNDPLDRPIAQTSTESGTTTNYAFTYLGVTNALSSETLSGATNTTKRYAFDAFGRRATIADGTSRYGYLHDPHGSVSLVVDQAGAVKSSYGYFAYGSSNSALTKTAAGFSLATNTYRYTGKRLDIASNTLDMGARRYSRSTSRFLQYDYYDGALADLGLSLDRLSGNRYGLAGGDPVNHVEVDGHKLALADAGGACPGCTIADAEAPIPQAGIPREGGAPSAPVASSGKDDNLGVSQCPGMRVAQKKGYETDLCTLPKPKLNWTEYLPRRTPIVISQRGLFQMIWNARGGKKRSWGSNARGGDGFIPIVKPKFPKREGAETADEAINLASPGRTRHILYGDATGGGHLWPGRPGKTPFPRDWSAGRVMYEISDIATDPASRVVGRPGGRTVLEGTRGGIRVRVVTDGRDIITGYPRNQPRNP